jgi:transcriptional regulator with XRE-family HTH domain
MHGMTNNFRLHLSLEPKVLPGKDLGGYAQRPMTIRSDQARLRIREEMERQKLSQREVADMLKWSQSRVAKNLTGRVEMTVDDLDSLCFAVGLSIVEALRDRGIEFCAEMTPTELRALERLRQMPAEERDIYLHLMEVKAHTRAEPRGATQKKPIIPRGRTR